MMNRKLSAGDIVEARCTRCKAVLNHRIIAMVEDRIVRVECNTCGGAHNYHQPATKEPRTATKKSASETPATGRKTKVEKESAERREWIDMRAAADTTAAVAYDMGRAYRVNDLIDHPVFGIGMVKQLLPPSKMDVLFQDGTKLLRCK